MIVSRPGRLESDVLFPIQGWRDRVGKNHFYAEGYGLNGLYVKAA